MSPCHDIMSLKRQLPVIKSNCGCTGEECWALSPAQWDQHDWQNDSLVRLFLKIKTKPILKLVPQGNYLYFQLSQLHHFTQSCKNKSWYLKQQIILLWSWMQMLTSWTRTAFWCSILFFSRKPCFNPKHTGLWVGSPTSAVRCGECEELFKESI